MKNSPFKSGTALLSNDIFEKFTFVKGQIENPTFQNEDFLSNILYLSLFLENLVLRENLVLLLPEDHPSYHENTWQEKIFDLDGLEIIIPSEEVHFNWSYDLHNELDSKLKKKRFWDDVDFDDLNLNEYVIYELKYWEKHKFPYIQSADPDNSVTFAQYGQIQETYSDLLIKEYNKFRSTSNDDIRKLVELGRNIHIFLPPISAIIFNKTDSIDNVFDVALELRNNFRELRKVIRSYESIVSDDSLSLRDSLLAANEFKNMMAELTKQVDKTKASSFSISEWRDTSNLLKLLDGISASDSSSLTSMILGKPLNIISEKIKIRKIRYLQKFSADFLNIKDYGKLIQKLTKKEITKGHIEYAKKAGFENLVS